MCSKQAQTTNSDVYSAAKSSEAEWYENDLHLAAELGKTLLDQNLDLKEALRQHQLVIEDQNLEIEYLTKQTVALKEVNESRVKIYEQLELTNQELEANNERLVVEGNSNKKKLSSQSTTIELLESRCEELQQSLDDFLQQSPKNPSTKPDPTRRHTVSNLQELLTKSRVAPSGLPVHLPNRTDEEVNQLHTSLKDVQAQRLHEQRRREALEEEVAVLLKEMKGLQDEVSQLHVQAAKAKTLQSELVAAKEANEFIRRCKKCSCSLEEIQGDKSLSVESDVEEDEQPSVSSGVVIKLDNGGHAYSSQDSLWSEGHTQEVDSTSSPAPGSNPPSLLSELDAHYRNIIGQLIKSQSPSSMTDVLTDCSLSFDGNQKGQDSSNVVCKPPKVELAGGHPLDLNHPLVLSYDHEEGISQGVQTEAYMPLHHRLHLPAQQGDPLHGYFCKTPEYKTIFQEIFLVLKQSVGSKSTVRPKPTSKEKQSEMIPMTMLCSD